MRNNVKAAVSEAMKEKATEALTVLKCSQNVMLR